MPELTTHSYSRARQKAFSLLELIVTISIVVILMTLTAPSILDIISTSRLTGSGDFVYNKLSQARQLAITDSRDIRVRIYARSDALQQDPLRETVPPEIAPRERDNEKRYANNLADDEAFDRLQFLGWQKDGSDEILTDLFSLEEGTVISRDPELSSLIASLPLSKSAESQSMARLPASYIEFAFHPDGSTNLPNAVSPDATMEQNNWFLTIVPDTVASTIPDRDEKQPQNFYCIQIDPDTGILSAYRP